MITIHAKRYEFQPAEITLKKGQSTRLVLISDDVAHGLSVDALGIDTLILKNHKNEVVVTPEKVGTFEGECSKFCGSGHSGMKLIVNVEP